MNYLIPDKWEVAEVFDMSIFDVKALLKMIAVDELAAIKIPNIYSILEIKTIISNIDKQGVMWYPNFEFKQGRIGICATEYDSKINGKEAYFTLEAESSKVRNNIFPNNLDPIKKMTDIFSSGYEISVATEPNMDNAKYFAGLVRAMQYESTIHFDYAPHQLQKWWVAESEVQFAVVIYLQMPGTGGELTIYEHQWKESDDKYNKDIDEKGPKGFDETVLKNSNSVEIHPQEGDMIIFNSKHFHKVKKIDSDRTRLSINSFMSLKNEKLYLWN
jgi:2OG-Fe(II) oxygenase superfamily